METELEKYLLSLANGVDEYYNDEWGTPKMFLAFILSRSVEIKPYINPKLKYVQLFEYATYFTSSMCFSIL